MNLSEVYTCRCRIYVSLSHTLTPNNHNQMHECIESMQISPPDYEKQTNKKLQFIAIRTVFVNVTYTNINTISKIHAFTLKWEMNAYMNHKFQIRCNNVIVL